MHDPTDHGEDIPQGRVIYQRQSGQSGQAINNPSLYYMNQMLRGVVTSGSGRSAAISGRDLAGKTGTTSDYKDAWFVGYTGGFITAVWVGKDDNTAMRGVTGGSSPAAIWKGFMEAALPRLDAPAIPNGPPLPPAAAPAGRGRWGRAAPRPGPVRPRPEPPCRRG